MQTYLYGRSSHSGLASEHSGPRDFGSQSRSQFFGTARTRRNDRPVFGPLTIQIGERSATVDCIAGPPSSEPLLGQVPLEIMDLVVIAASKRLVRGPSRPGCHP